MKGARRMERNPAGLGHVYINTVDGSIAFYSPRHASLTIGRFFSLFFFFLHEASFSASPHEAAPEGAIDKKRNYRVAVVSETQQNVQNRTGIFNYARRVPIARKYRPISPIDIILLRSLVTTFVNANLD